jgi:hypothetical protein
MQFSARNSIPLVFGGCAKTQSPTKVAETSNVIVVTLDIRRIIRLPESSPELFTKVVSSRNGKN